jgi:solute carrier family 35 (UDP-sugar transporter), member A1/2/3
LQFANLVWSLRNALHAQEDGGVKGLIRTIKRDIVNQPVEMLKMFVPAGLYCVQNNLAYVAISNLDGPTYQLLYQLKILTTAMFSVLMLRRSLGTHQWVSLVLLSVGVGLVQLSSAKPSSSGGSAVVAGNTAVGLLAVTSACMTSGFAGVYFEKVLKTSKVSLWIRNIQLAGYGIIIGLGGVYLGPDAVSVRTNGFLHGYNWTVWMSVLLNSLGGLVVAMVVKYADNVVKGFATSISILMTCTVSYFLFNFAITGQFLLGASIVLYSTYLYGQARMPGLPKLIHSKLIHRRASTHSNEERGEKVGSHHSAGSGTPDISPSNSTKEGAAAAAAAGTAGSKIVDSSTSNQHQPQKQQLLMRKSVSVSAFSRQQVSPPRK